MTAKRAAKKAPAKAGARGAAIDNEMQREYRMQTEEDAKEYGEISKRQKAWAYKVAEAIDRGLPLEGRDAKLAAGCVRIWADSLTGIRKKGPGKPPSFDHSRLAFDYWKLRMRDGLKDDPAKGKLAEQYGCSKEQVRNIVAKLKKDVREMLSMGTVYWKDETTKEK